MPNSQYQVDIIVPIYNIGKYLEKCIQSLIDQTYKDCNIILIDDGSTDYSGKLCDFYAEKYKNITVVHKRNGGLVSAWMCGYKISNSDWVIFVDGDDWVEKQHVEKLVRAQKNTNADIVITRMKQINNNRYKYIQFDITAGVYRGKKLINELYPVMINSGGFEKRGIPFSRCSKLIRKKLIAENLKYLYRNATFEEDFNIVAPICLDAACIVLIESDNAAYCYRRVDQSMLHGYSRNMADSIKNIYPLLYQAILDKGKDIFKPQLDAEYLSANIRLYTNELRSPERLRTIENNIGYIAKDKKLIECIDNKKLWNNYPLKFKIVVFALKNYGNIAEKIITVLLLIIRRVIL